VAPRRWRTVEIFSPSNQAETRAELLRRNSDGTWPEMSATTGADGELGLASINFSVPLAASYRTTRLAARR
jgi:hypothetical protein